MANTPKIRNLIIIHLYSTTLCLLFVKACLHLSNMELNPLEQIINLMNDVIGHDEWKKGCLMKVKYYQGGAPFHDYTLQSVKVFRNRNNVEEVAFPVDSPLLKEAVCGIIQDFVNRRSDTLRLQNAEGIKRVDSIYVTSWTFPIEAI